MSNSEIASSRWIEKYRSILLVFVLVAILSFGIAVLHLILLRISAPQPLVWVSVLYFLVASLLGSLLVLVCNDVCEGNCLPLYASVQKIIVLYGGIISVSLVKLIVLALPVVLLYWYLRYLASVPEYNIVYQNAETIAEQNSIIAFLGFLLVYPFFIGLVVSRFFVIEPLIVVEKRKVTQAIWQSFAMASNLFGTILTGMLLFANCIFLQVISAMRPASFSLAFLQDVRFVFGLHAICSLLILVNGLLKASLYLDKRDKSRDVSSSKDRFWGWLW